MKRHLNFKMLSLNVRGICSFDKRKALFNWIAKERSDIIFLQETYCIPEVENIWKSQWRGSVFFSHRSQHSRGVIILLKENFDCQVNMYREDEQGRFLILKAFIQGQSFMRQTKLKTSARSSKKFINNLIDYF